MKRLNKLVISGMLMVSPMLFTACSEDNKVGRDSNVPNNIEDNYTGDADHNRTGENEEEVKRRTKDFGNDVSNGVNRTTDKMSNAVNGTVITTDSRTYSSNEYNSLKMRVDKLEKDLMDLKSKRVGRDIVGQK